MGRRNGYPRLDTRCIFSIVVGQQAPEKIFHPVDVNFAGHTLLSQVSTGSASESTSLLAKLSKLFTSNKQSSSPTATEQAQLFDLNVLLETADQVFVQQSGAGPPPQVLGWLGNKMPDIPNVQLVWGRDAGSHIPMLAIATPEALATLITENTARTELPEVIARKEKWEQSISNASSDYSRNQYIALRQIVPSGLTRLC